MRVEGSGVRGQGPTIERSRVQSSGFRCQVSGVRDLRLKGLGFRVQDSGVRGQGSTIERSRVKESRI